MTDFLNLWLWFTSCLLSMGLRLSPVWYILTTLLPSDTFMECQEMVSKACEVLDNLGCTIRPVKSVFKPSQTIEFLGFQIDYHNMLVSLETSTSAETDKTRQACLYLFRKFIYITIRQLTEVTGQLVAAQPGVWIAPLFFKCLESVKDCALKAENGNYDAKIEVPQVAKEDLAWWIFDNHNGNWFSSTVNRNKPSVCVKSDASNGKTTGGMWMSEESALHIILHIKILLQ